MPLDVALILHSRSPVKTTAARLHRKVSTQPPDVRNSTRFDDAISLHCNLFACLLCGFDHLIHSYWVEKCIRILAHRLHENNLMRVARDTRTVGLGNKPNIIPDIYSRGCRPLFFIPADSI